MKEVLERLCKFLYGQLIVLLTLKKQTASLYSQNRPLPLSILWTDVFVGIDAGGIWTMTELITVPKVLRG